MCFTPPLTICGVMATGLRATENEVLKSCVSTPRVGLSYARVLLTLSLQSRFEMRSLTNVPSVSPGMSVSDSTASRACRRDVRWHKKSEDEIKKSWEFGNRGFEF